MPMGAVGRAMLLTAAASVSACMVGPDFNHPALSEAAGYSQTPLTQRTTAAPTQAGIAQTFIPGRDIPGDWWTIFGSPALARMVEQALHDNPNVEAAQAALRQTQETADAARGALFPSLAGKSSATRVGFSAASIGQTYTKVFTLSTQQLTVSYTLDIFGGTRRQIEAAEAQADYQRFQLEATYLTLTSNVIVAAIQEASLRAQIAATQDIIGTNRDVLQTVQKQLAAGGVSGSDVATQETSLAQTTATLPTLEQNLAQQRTQLAMLLGQFPNQSLPNTLDFSQLHLPEELPISLPSHLVEQRPDVASAEAQLHAATAQVGVAIANMLPQISLSAGYGTIGLGDILGPGSPIWNLGANISQPLFQGGQLLHQRRAAQAGLEAAAAQYRGTVLGAFQNVASALSALRTDADALAAQSAADQASRKSFSIARSQYQAGATSFLTLLNAQNARAQVEIALIRAQTNRYLDTVALYQALGGGWWNRDDTTTDKKS
jgi:NodT family efflux transporter outer membrane factor (OMF) lipoprotein